MEPISVTSDTLADVLAIGLYVGVNEDELPKTKYSREIDFFRWLRYDNDDRLLGVDFLASGRRGIDLRDMPDSECIAAGLEQLRNTLGLVLVT